MATPARGFELDGHEASRPPPTSGCWLGRWFRAPASPRSRGGPCWRRSSRLVSSSPLLRPREPGRRLWPRPRLDLPLQYLPVLGSGAADPAIDRQIGQRGQCQHFMARTNDGLSPNDPRFGVPGALVTTAYARCVAVVGVGVRRDPARSTSRERTAGRIYSPMHALEDSFSAAHVERDARLQHRAPLSWTLIDWPRYCSRPRRFPAPDPSRGDGSARPRLFRWDFKTGTVVPALLSPPLRLSRGVPDRLGARGRGRRRRFPSHRIDPLEGEHAEGRQPSLFGRPRPKTPRSGRGSCERTFRASPRRRQMPHERFDPLPRPDVLLVVQGLAGQHELGLGCGVRGSSSDRRSRSSWGCRARRSRPRQRHPRRSVGVNLFCPSPPFAIGATPAALRVACDTPSNRACRRQGHPRAGSSSPPARRAGPLWRDRAVVDDADGGGDLGRARFGWSHEFGLDARPPGPEQSPPGIRRVPTRSRLPESAIDAHHLPRGDRGFRARQPVRGVGPQLALDRDGWNRRSGVAPGFQLEINQGRIHSPSPEAAWLSRRPVGLSDAELAGGHGDAGARPHGRPGGQAFGLDVAAAWGWSSTSAASRSRSTHRRCLTSSRRGGIHSHSRRDSG